VLTTSTPAVLAAASSEAAIEALNLTVKCSLPLRQHRDAKMA
jgi:hypothetical protein